MAKRLALIGLILSAVAIAAAYATAFSSSGAGKGAALMMAMGIATMAVSLMILGALRDGEKMGVLGVAFGFVFAVLVLGFASGIFLSDTDSATSRLWLGLPRRAAIIVYGIGFLPVFVLPFIYAYTFESRTLRPEDLDRIRVLREENETRATEGATG